MALAAPQSDASRQALAAPWQESSSDLHPLTRCGGQLVIATDAWKPQVNGVVRTLDTTISVLEGLGVHSTIIHPGLFRNFATPWYPEIAISYGRMQRIIRKLMDKTRPVSIHIATEGPVGRAVRRYCLRRGLRFTTAYHTKFPEYLKHQVGLPLWVGYSYLRRFHRPSARVLVATESMRDHLQQRRFSNRIGLWSRGVDAELFRPRQRSVIRDKPVCLYVGRVSVEKNIEDFLRADIDCHKVVVGDGPARKSLEEAFPRVTFTGYKHGEELAQAYADADVFVFPSTTDTFGMVIIEALACGVPVAAYPVPGPMDIVPNGAGVGCLHADLKIAIETALASSDRQKCRELALRYTWENCTKQFLNSLVVTKDAI
jgi:glycosyltransferase involved in cell wall biosynthesis